jgi:YD repeat-containing protein
VHAGAVHRAAAATTSDPSFLVSPNSTVYVQRWSELTPATCATQPGTFTATIAPTHGTLTFTVETHLIPAGEPCAGQPAQYSVAYYTWTDASATVNVATDPFHLHWDPGNGGITEDTDWVADLANNPDNNGGYCIWCRIKQLLAAASPLPTFGEGSPVSPLPTFGEGDSVNSATGNKFQAETDFAAEPHTGVALIRYYNSQDATAYAFGNAWHSTWHHGLSVNGNIVTATRADGRRDVFTDNGSGVYTAAPDVFVNDSNGRVIQMTAPDGGVYAYAYSASGNLASVTLSWRHAAAICLREREFSERADRDHRRKRPAVRHLDL